MQRLRAFWEKFDADAAFSFTTPRYEHCWHWLMRPVDCCVVEHSNGALCLARLVRIQDRRLGIPYIIFLLAIIGYIIGFVVVRTGGYLAYEGADGVTRLQVWFRRPCANANAQVFSAC